MHLSHLKLINVRRFKELQLEFGPGVTILSGENAHGKTTILESIYLLAIARSFRASNEREMVNWGSMESQESALIDATLLEGTDRHRVIIGYSPVQTSRVSPSIVEDHSNVIRKEIRVDGIRRTASDLIGLFNVVLFSADDIGLVQGPPALRRKYLDILISQADPKYMRNLQRYQKVLQQRNQLLKLLSENRAKEVELEFWDEELVREGSQITDHRSQSMDSIAKLARIQHLELTGELEKLELLYQPNVSTTEANSNPSQDKFRILLQSARRRELALKTTIIGPHRDDFKLLVNGADMNRYSSRGQARTLTLTLRLSEAEYLSKMRGGPVVLLDDVLSELDTARRQQVLQKSLGYEQTLITATDLGFFPQEFLAQARVLKVLEGTVEDHL